MDLHYENLVLEQPQNIELWSAYANSLSDPLDRAKLLTRALAAVPDRALWQRLIELRRKNGPKAREALYETIRDALAVFPKDKQLWAILLEEFPGRDAFDQYLRYGPDPESIWPKYLAWAAETSEDDVVLRYLEFFKNPVELAGQLAGEGRAALALRIMRETPLKSLDDAKLLLQVAETAESPDCPAFYRSALALFPESDGWIVPAFAVHLAGQGESSEAQSVLDSGLRHASSVRAFAEIFAAACAFFEQYIVSLEAARRASDRIRAVFQQLLSRRRLLLNDVQIRTEPNFVPHWLERAALFTKRDYKAGVYDEALSAIDPRRAEGLADLWIAYAELFSSMTEVRTLFDRAVKVRYRLLDDLVAVWIAWAKRELVHDPRRALKVLEKATNGPAESSILVTNDKLSPQERLHKSPALWAFYLSLAAKHADLDKVRQVYSQTLHYKVASVSSVIQYADLLTTHGFVDESYRIFERAIDKFPFPAAFGLWIAYLDRVGESQLSLERLRDLYEQVLNSCPADQALPFFLRYAQLELDRGLVSNAISILQRGAETLPPADLPELYGVYLTVVKENRGLESTRPVYEHGVSRLQYENLGSFAREFAEAELELGDLGRARAVLKFAAQFFDPQLPKGAGFWNRWQEIEQEHGDQASFRDMLLVKRSVEEAVLNDPYKLADREEHIEFVKG